jgi:hypothetical protein
MADAGLMGPDDAFLEFGVIEQSRGLPDSGNLVGISSPAL